MEKRKDRSDQEREEVVSALKEFVVRTATSENPPPEAITALPRVADIVLGYL